MSQHLTSDWLRQETLLVAKLDVASTYFIEQVEAETRKQARGQEVLPFLKGGSYFLGNCLFELVCAWDRIEAHYASIQEDIFLKPELGMAFSSALPRLPGIVWNAHNGFNEPRRA